MIGWYCPNKFQFNILLSQFELSPLHRWLNMKKMESRFKIQEMGTVVHNGIHHQSHFYHICYMSYFVSPHYLLPSVNVSRHLHNIGWTISIPVSISYIIFNSNKPFYSYSTGNTNRQSLGYVNRCIITMNIYQW